MDLAFFLVEFLQEPICSFPISVVSLSSTSLPDGRPCITVVKHQTLEFSSTLQNPSLPLPEAHNLR